MKTIQQYFEANFEKGFTVIKIPKINEELSGDTLIIENYPKLTQLNLKELSQVEEVIIKNCPQLTSIKYNQQKQEEKPIIIQPEKKGIDWMCIIGFTSGLTALIWNIYRKWRRRTEAPKRVKIASFVTRKK